MSAVGGAWGAGEPVKLMLIDSADGGRCRRRLQQQQQRDGADDDGWQAQKEKEEGGTVCCMPFQLIEFAQSKQLAAVTIDERVEQATTATTNGGDDGAVAAEMGWRYDEESGAWVKEGERSAADREASIDDDDNDDDDESDASDSDVAFKSAYASRCVCPAAMQSCFSIVAPPVGGGNNVAAVAAAVGVGGASASAATHKIRFRYRLVVSKASSWARRCDRRRMPLPFHMTTHSSSSFSQHLFDSVRHALARRLRTQRATCNAPQHGANARWCVCKQTTANHIEDDNDDDDDSGNLQQQQQQGESRRRSGGGKAARSRVSTTVDRQYAVDDRSREQQRRESHRSKVKNGGGNNYSPSHQSRTNGEKWKKKAAQVARAQLERLAGRTRRAPPPSLNKYKKSKRSKARQQQQQQASGGGGGAASSSHHNLVAPKPVQGSGAYSLAEHTNFHSFRRSFYNTVRASLVNVSVYGRRVADVRFAPTASHLRAQFMHTMANYACTPSLVFHGTHVARMQSICDRGLIVPGQRADVSVVNGSAFGVGIYTARSMDASFGYMRDTYTMFACAVLEPYRAALASYNSNRPLYLSTPHVVVLFQSCLVLPMFLIDFDVGTPTRNESPPSSSSAGLTSFCRPVACQRLRKLHTLRAHQRLQLKNDARQSVSIN